MKLCYNCKGKIEKTIGTISIAGVTIQDVKYEECQNCYEKYYDIETSKFIQNIKKYITSQRKELQLALMNG